MCEFQDSNCNGFGDMWWTDKCIYFSSRPIDGFGGQHIQKLTTEITVFLDLSFLYDRPYHNSG